VAVLITGADGYLGRRIARKLLDTTDESVLLGVRAASQSELQRKIGPLLDELAVFGARVRWFPLDLTSDAESALPRAEITRIVHSAAVTAFNVEQEKAQAVNVEGTRRVLELATRCPKLERVAVLGTVYASGLRSGPVNEDWFDDSAGFANHYEASKQRAEHLLRDAYRDLPWQLYRVATVLADNQSGDVVQFNVVHKVWRLLYWGLLPLVPGTETVPLYLVTGDFVTESICELMRHGADRKIYHVCHGREDAISLGQWVDLAHRLFLVDDAFRKRRILKPLFVDETAFYRMADNASMFSQDTLRHAVQLVRPFAKQMFIDKSITNDHLRADLSSYRTPDIQGLLGTTCAKLIATEWGTGDAPSLRMSDGGA
jgi:nucleoside-diphosphate-sugar epimerase